MSTERVTLTLEKDQVEKIRSDAHKNHSSFSSYVGGILSGKYPLVGTFHYPEANFKFTGSLDDIPHTLRLSNIISTELQTPFLSGFIIYRFDTLRVEDNARQHFVLEGKGGGPQVLHLVQKIIAEIKPANSVFNAKKLGF